MAKKAKFEIGKIIDPSFEDMDKNELIANLQSTSTHIEKGSYTKRLTQDELGIAKSEFSEISITISKLEDEKKEAMAEFKEALDRPKKTAKELLETIKSKSIRKEGILYLVDDQEAGTMYYFDEDAICVDYRPLAPKERQTSIMAGVRNLKTGNE